LDCVPFANGTLKGCQHDSPNEMKTEPTNIPGTTRITDDPFDPMTPSNLQEPFCFSKRLREKRPVYWNEKYSFWMLTRHQDVKAILRAPNQFSSATGIEIQKRAEQFPASVRASFHIGKRFMFGHLQASDAPEHTQDRGKVMNAFIPLVGAAMRASIQERVDGLIDEMERREACDFVSTFAYPLPSSVIFDLLGVPAEHHRTISESSAAAATFNRSVYNRDFEAIENIAEKLTESGKVLQGLIEERRREPKNDLISALVHGAGASAWLPDDELAVLFHFILVDGH
jgi:cytochrome P450